MCSHALHRIAYLNSSFKKLTILFIILYINIRSFLPTRFRQWLRFGMKTTLQSVVVPSAIFVAKAVVFSVIFKFFLLLP